MSPPPHPGQHCCSRDELLHCFCSTKKQLYFRWGQKKKCRRQGCPQWAWVITCCASHHSNMHEWEITTVWGAITSLKLVCVRWHYPAGWGAITELFAAPEEKVSFCLWFKEVKVLQMFYISYKKVQLWVMGFFFRHVEAVKSGNSEQKAAGVERAPGIIYIWHAPSTGGHG